VGTLTQELAKKAGKIIAIEKDKKMISVLSESMADYKNVQVLNDDILEIDFENLLQNKKYKVVANIPYYLTSPLIRKLLETKNQPQSIILMIQKEVAERICAKPPHMSLLAVSVQFYAAPKIMANVSKNCFMPAPKIDSAIIKIIPQIENKKQVDEDLFFKIVKAGFSQPRKQLIGNLSKNLELNREEANSWLIKNKIEPKQRAETLDINDWINLAESFNLGEETLN